MTTEETQRLAIRDLDEALASSMRCAAEARRVADSYQVAARRLEADNAELRHENDALLTQVSGEAGRTEALTRAFHALRVLHEATVNDRNRLAQRLAEAEMQLDQERDARPWWRVWFGA